MYFTGELKIDPSQETIITKDSSKGFFGKLFPGLKPAKEWETETFSALQIMQKMYHILSALDIKNVRRFIVDNHQVYVDTRNNVNDLDQVIMDYELNTDEIEGALFQHIELQLAYSTPKIDYLIKIDFERKHEKGVYPLVVKVKGLVNPGGTALTKEYIKTIGDSFIYFLNKIDFAFRNYLEVDNIKSDHDVELVLNQHERAEIKSQTTNSFEQGSASLNDLFSHFGSGNFDSDIIEKQISDISKRFDKMGFPGTKTFSNSSVTYTCVSYVQKGDDIIEL